MGRRIDSSSFGGGARFPFWATRGPSSVAIVEMSTESCHERMLGGKEKRRWGGGREEGKKREREGEGRRHRSLQILYLVTPSWLSSEVKKIWSWGLFESKD